MQMKNEEKKISVVDGKISEEIIIRTFRGKQGEQVTGAIDTKTTEQCILSTD